MLPELSELAGGLPIAASFAMATGITALREGRRRSALNEAMHELRRPLQGLALSLPADDSREESAESFLRLTVAAVERLDREINGGGLASRTSPVSLKPVVALAVERWQRAAEIAERSVALTWMAHDPVLQVEPVEFEQALDNLISNGLVHGAGAVVVEVAEGYGRLRVVVRDDGCLDGAPGSRQMHLPARISGRERHGHGLKVVRRLAARCGGSFHLRRSPTGTEACLELPLDGARR